MSLNPFKRANKPKELCIITNKKAVNNNEFPNCSHKYRNV